MKLIIVLITVLTSMTALAKSYDIQCKGLTYEGDTYTVKSSFKMNANILEKEPPFERSLDRRSLVQLTVTRDSQVIYNDALFMNDIQVTIADDQTTYDFSRLEVEKSGNLESATFSPVPMDKFSVTMSEEASSPFNFEILGGWGKFNNGNCSID